MNAHYYGLILAGGRGTRFWPRSRKRSAKQVLNVVGDRTLIQATVDRLAPVIPPERLWILTNGHLRDKIVRQLPDVPPEQILAEPAQRNTAPAIGLAAHILHSLDPDAVMGVFPADHVVGKPGAYRKVLQGGVPGRRGRPPDGGGDPAALARDRLRLHRVPARHRSRRRHPVPVRHFHEKPDAAKARRYVAAGAIYWNSGMFFWRADVLLDALRRHLPKTATILASLPPLRSAPLRRAAQGGLPAVREHLDRLRRAGEGRQRERHSRRRFRLERRGKLERGLRTAAARRPRQRVIHDSVCLDSHNNFVDARGKVVALLGVNDLIVVDTPDALLVASRDRAQPVGEILKTLEKRDRHDLL